MNVVVCVKQIPDPAEPGELDPESHTLKRDGKLILDESDSYGVEMALQLVDTAGEGEVSLVSMAPNAEVSGLRTALAMGADRARLVLANASDTVNSNIILTVRELSESVPVVALAESLDSVDVLDANTRNNPIEDIESHVPLRVDRYELREEGGGLGQWRGGVSTIREISFLTDGGAAVEGDGHKFEPWGFEGGADGRTAELIYDQGEAGSVSLPSKVQYKPIRAGERLICRGAGGGGYGRPFDRDPQMVLDDVLDGLYSAETARESYGVVIADGAVDEIATETRRASG